MKRRTITIYLLIILSLTGITVPAFKVQADPVTSAILAPVALQGTKSMLPLVTRSLQATTGQLLKMGVTALGVLRLPLGILECTIGAPFGFFSHGLMNITQGGISLLRFIIHTIMLPLALAGVG